MPYYIQLCIKNMSQMNKSTTILLLIGLAYSTISFNIKAQEININDSLDYIVQKQMAENILFKKNQLKIEEEEILKIADALPAFGVYKDTYFTSGIPLNEKVDRNTADAMFQISIRHRLTKSILPFNSFLYFTYTQKSFWDIYAESAPFKDLNYNPSIGVGRYIIHNHKLIGTTFIQVEHESNGKSGDDSRSWNMISFSGKYFYNLQVMFGAKVWIPFIDGEENRDLLDYRGIGYFTMDYITKDKKWWLSAELNPRKDFANLNTTLTAGFKVSANANQYIYARFYNGTSESLLEYNRYDINIRIGFCIKPDFKSLF